jgi:adenine-specific DNA-methyltransferase
MPELTWKGKAAITEHHLDVPVCELVPVFKCDDKGVKTECSTDLLSAENLISESTGNRILHGDNLLALKALLPEYEGRIKCIYIDPPYNTGNEGWVYNDNVNSPEMRNWLGRTVGKAAEDLNRHDKWLCMLYPRLKLLHQLLADDGAIFISIDDNEQHHLRMICDEIFGERNYLGMITRKQSSGSKNDTGNSKIITTVDYILCYKKKSFEFYAYQIENKKKFLYNDAIGDFSIRALEMQGGDDTLPKRSKMGYSIYYNKITNDVKTLFDYDLDKEKVYENENEALLKTGYKCYRPRKRGNHLGRWRWGLETFIERLEDNLVYFDDKRVYMKERASNFVNKYPEALLENFLNTEGTNELKEIFSNKNFDFPKPSNLIKFLCSVSTKPNDIILDSFAGSGTTAHAVINLNKDGGKRKYILIEMEDYAENITAERVRRVLANNAAAAEKELGFEENNSTNGFVYYDLGCPLFLEDKNLNPAASVAALRQYIWCTETNHIPANEKTALQIYDTPDAFYLGKSTEIHYFFCYDGGSKECVLDRDLLRALLLKCPENAEKMLIYADNLLLDDIDMAEYGIIFKKIPRNIIQM